MMLVDIIAGMIAGHGKPYHRKIERRRAMDAITETLVERRITSAVTARVKDDDVGTIRFLPFWRARSDDELIEAWRRFAPQTRRDMV